MRHRRSGRQGEHPVGGQLLHPSAGKHQNYAKLDEAAINKLPNSGIVKKGTDIQIVYGLQVADIKRAVEAQLENQ